MKHIYTFFILITLSYFATAHAAESSTENAAIHSSVAVFFEQYLDAYNQRFGHPDKADEFVADLQALIHEPFLMSPVNNPPFRLPDTAALKRGFDGFVQQLEQKGVTQLVWRSTQTEVLSANKVLANNHAVGVDAAGKVVYETKSLYLLTHQEGRWQIALFSPYDVDRAIGL